MKHTAIKTRPGEAVMVYAGDGQIVLQVRRLVHGAEDPASSSFKSGLTLSPTEAAKVAAALLTAAGEQAARSTG